MRAGRRILIVDDDGALRQSLAEQLELHNEFVCVECGTAARALEIVGGERFDTIVLDVGLPDMDGRELCRLLRSAGVRVPIVMLTGADSEPDTILGLEVRRRRLCDKAVSAERPAWRACAPICARASTATMRCS